MKKKAIATRNHPSVDMSIINRCHGLDAIRNRNSNVIEKIYAPTIVRVGMELRLGKRALIWIAIGKRMLPLMRRERISGGMN